MVFCLSNKPNENSIAMRYGNKCCFSRVTWALAACRMLWGAEVTGVYLMEMATGCLAFGKGRSLPWEFLVFFFLAWSSSASRWALIVWECHLQSLNILPPRSPPGFACYIVLHSSCPSIGMVRTRSSPLKRCVCINHPPPNTKILSITVTSGASSGLQHAW